MTKPPRDFTLPAEEYEPKTFTIAGVVYQAVPSVHPRQLVKLVASLRGLSSLAGKELAPDEVDKALTELGGFFEAVLLPEDANTQGWLDAYAGDEFDLQKQVIPIMTWLLEEYTGRPTQPLSDSVTGIDNGGLTLTDGAVQEALIN